jgi:outer membrane protein insertion porin family
MKHCKRWYLLLWLGSALSCDTHHLRFKGLHHVSEHTVRTHLSQHPTLTSSEIIHILYKTNLFEDISVSNNCTVTVQERPAIHSITIDKGLNRDGILNSLYTLGMSESGFYNASSLMHFEKMLQTYAPTTLKTRISERPDGSIDLIIHEAPKQYIEKIIVEGHHYFSRATLLRWLRLSTKHHIAHWFKWSVWSPYRVTMLSEHVLRLYHTKGFPDATVNITEHHGVVTLHIHEGNMRYLKGYTMTGDTLANDWPTLKALKRLQRYDIRLLEALQADFKKAYGDLGYLFGRIVIQRKVINATTDSLSIDVQKGTTMRLNRVHIVGNTRTVDTVIRSKVDLTPGQMVRQSDIDHTTDNLNRLGFFQTVHVDVVPINNTTADARVTVQEMPSIAVKGGLGYSNNDGILLNGSYHQPNFLGLGHTVSLAVNMSHYAQQYSAQYINPEWRPKVGHGIDIFYAHTNTDNMKVPLATYALDQYGVNGRFMLSPNRITRWVMGYGYLHSVLKIGDHPSNELINFINQTNTLPLPVGTQPITQEQIFSNGMVRLGLEHTTLDSLFFSKKGMLHTANVELAAPFSHESFFYWKTTYSYRGYHTPFSGLMLLTKFDAGYGAGNTVTHDLPNYTHFFSGSVGNFAAIRGYRGYGIGPRDSNHDPLGGNAVMAGSVAITFPYLNLPDRLRTMLFLDAGNVFNTTRAKTTYSEGSLRYSTGIAIQLRAPMLGIVLVSLGYPLNLKTGDTRETLQFSFGSNF